MRAQKIKTVTKLALKNKEHAKNIVTFETLPLRLHNNATLIAPYRKKAEESLAHINALEPIRKKKWLKRIRKRIKAHYYPLAILKPKSYL